MRKFKWHKKRVMLSDGFHQVYELLTKKFDPDGRWRGQWITATNEEGRPIRIILMGNLET